MQNLTEQQLCDLKLEVVLHQGEKLLISKSVMVELLLAYDVLQTAISDGRFKFLNQESK